MNDTEQAQAYRDTDFSEPHEAFVNLFRECFPDFLTGRVLDLGCGTADVIIRLAKALPGLNIIGLDGAPAMLDIAREDVKANSLGDRIFLKETCLSGDKSIRDRYDAVISNSLLHHLDDPLLLWRTIRNCTNPGSPVFIMDLMRPDDKETAGRFTDLYAADAPLILKKDFYNSLLAAYSVDEVKQQLTETGLDCLNIDIVSDRHYVVRGNAQ